MSQTSSSSSDQCSTPPFPSRSLTQGVSDYVTPPRGEDKVKPKCPGAPPDNGTLGRYVPNMSGCNVCEELHNAESDESDRPNFVRSINF